MKFRFYITDPYNGALHGTNSETLAKSYAEFEDYFVVDTLHSLWLQPGDTPEEVTEAEEFEPEPESEDEED